jgi:hypothetical protein
MKQKVESGGIADEFISVKHFSDDQPHSEQRTKNLKVRTMQSFHNHSPRTSRQQMKDSLFIREQGNSLDSDLPSLQKSMRKQKVALQSIVKDRTLYQMQFEMFKSQASGYRKR